MPVGDDRIRAYFLDRLFVAHGRGERLLGATLERLPDRVAATSLADRLLFERTWALDPDAPALRPEAEAADSSRRAEELWTSAAHLLGTAARVAAGLVGLPGSADELLERSILLRDYAGHGRRQLVLFPFPPGADAPSAVVKIVRAAARSRVAGAGAPLRAERETLGRLAEELPASLAATVPAPLAHESGDGEEVLVVSHLEGRPVYLDLQNRPLGRRGASAHLREAADWLSAFHRATRHPDRRMTVGDEDRAHAARLADTGGPVGDAAWLEELACALEEHPVSLAAGHGDYWPRNLLRRGDGGATDAGVPPVGVVDWERFTSAASPTEDLFHFAIAYGSSVRWRGTDRVGLEEAFRRIFFAEHRVARAVGDYLERYAARTEIPPALLPSLLRLHVLRRHREAGGPGERAGWAACWRRLAVDRSPVLERFG